MQVLGTVPWVLPLEGPSLGAGVCARMPAWERGGGWPRGSGLGDVGGVQMRQGLHPWRCQPPGGWPHRGGPVGREPAGQPRPVSSGGNQPGSARSPSPSLRCRPEAGPPSLRSPGAPASSKLPCREVQPPRPAVWGGQRLARDPVRRGQARFPPHARWGPSSSRAPGGLQPGPGAGSLSSRTAPPHTAFRASWGHGLLEPRPLHSHRPERVGGQPRVPQKALRWPSRAGVPWHAPQVG